MKNNVLRILFAVTPLLLSVVFGWSVTAGYIFSGDKSIVLVIPLLVWSVLFFIFNCILWLARHPLNSTVMLSASLATAIGGVLVAVMFFGASWSRF